MTRSKKNLPGDVYKALKRDGPTTAYMLAVNLNPRYSGTLTSSRIGQCLKGLENAGQVHKVGSTMAAFIWGAVE